MKKKGVEKSAVNARHPRLFLFVLLFAATATAQDTSTCLRIKGRFENAFYKDRTPCFVAVKCNDLTDTIRLTYYNKKFRYNFVSGNYYTLRVTKKGFAPLVIGVDTRSGGRPDRVYQFKFSTRLITEKRARTFNQEAIKCPITIIKYVEERRGYHYDKTYTETIKCKMVLISNLGDFSTKRDRSGLF